MKENGNYYFYHNDQLGTPQKMTATNGAVVWAEKYSSFGEVTVDASSIATNPLRFPGQYYDQETGIHYNYHRYYDPRTGRYLRADPIGLKRGLNLFIYTVNNSTNRIDPFGLDMVGDYYRYIEYQNYLSGSGYAPPGEDPWTFNPQTYKPPVDPVNNVDPWTPPPWALDNPPIPPGVDPWHPVPYPEEWRESCDTPGWYCRWGSAVIGAGLDVAGIGLTLSRVGMIGSSIPYGISITNSGIYAFVCGKFASASASTLLNTASLAATAKKIPGPVGTGAAVADITINLGPIFFAGPSE